jgi:uncharacterized protein YecE (DUF72 family)
MPPGCVRVGTSGWSYPHWRARFYPRGLRHASELRFAAERLDALEINTTFYGSLRPTTFTAWQTDTADLAASAGFRFAVKGSRYITHMKKLREVATALANFYATGPLLLGGALGPFLWQLPPMLRFDADLLARFFDLLPRTAGAAQRLAARHDERFAGRATTERGPGLPARAVLEHALEPRHPSFDCDAFVRLCERHDVAVVHADTAGKHVALAAPGAGLAYLRLHGSRRLYGSRYLDEELDAWAARIRGLAAREVYVFFDNDARAYAARDAMRLRERLEDLLPLARAEDRDRRDGGSAGARRDRARGRARLAGGARARADRRG